MSTVRLLSPGINLVAEVTALVTGIHAPSPASADVKNLAVANGVHGQKDFSKTIVVFPGKRPAHVLRKYISQRIGTSFIPPKIYSIDQFVDLLCTLRTGTIAPAIGEYDAVAILFDLHNRLQGDLRIGQEHFSTLDAFYPVGVKIFSELEELTIASVDDDRLQQAVSSVTLASAQTLASLSGPFYAALQQHGFTSRALRYRSAADGIGGIDLSEYGKIVLAGFFAFTQTEERMVRHLLTLDTVTVLFQNGEGIRATLETLGIDPPPEGDEREQEIRFYESPDAHGQLFVLNRILDETYREPVTDSDEAVIVLPSAENLFPLYHQTLSVYEQQTYNLSLGYPLSRTPVYGFLMSLMDVVVSSKDGEVYVPKYVQFLLHPYTKNILFKTRTDVTRIAVHSIQKYCLEHSAKVFMSLDAIEQDPRLYAGIADRLKREDVEIAPDEVRAHVKRIHDVTLRSMFSVRSIAEFSDACIAVLRFINEQSTAHRHPYFRPFVETLIEQCVQVRASLLSRQSFGAPEQYLMFLRHVAASAEVPFTGTPLQGLQVLGFLETRGLQFNSVFIIDVNDDIIPGRAQQDVLLPLSVRETLGLSTYREQERIKSYIFDVLRKGAKTVHLLYVNNNEKEQSRFIAQMQWNRQLRAGSVKQFNTFAQEYAVDLGTHEPGEIRKDEPTVSLLKSMKFSSTALDTYLTCGRRFYYRFVLRLQEAGEISGDVEQTDIGSVVHDILHEYFSPLKEKQLSASDIDTVRLQRIIQDNFRSLYGNAQFGEQYVTKKQVERHLIEYFANVQRPIAERFAVTIEALEDEFTAEIDSMTFTGRFDRIESRNGKTYIIDFKTGYNEASYRIAFDGLNPGDRTTWKPSIGSLQLPMYLMLYSSIRKIPVKEIVPAFVFIGKKELNEEIEVPLCASEGETETWYPKLREIILSIAREITDPSKSFVPTDDIKNDCPGCPYAAMCGTLWTEKYSY
jgi:CRISPR/Cas system-associated exonuclease Cas4 (RecB family)